MVRVFVLLMFLVSVPAVLADDAKVKDAAAPAAVEAEKAGGCMPDGGCCGGSGGCAEAMKAEHGTAANAAAADDGGGCPCQRARKAREQQKLKEQQKQAQ